jgi:DNA processing protein
MPALSIWNDSHGMTETEAWLRLAQTPGLDVRQLDGLLAEFGSVVAVCDASDRALRGAGLDEAPRRRLAEPDPELMRRAIDWLQDDTVRHRLVPWTDALYPPRLRQIPDPPPVLFVAGNPALLEDPQLAVVGSRNPSPGGRDNARQFAAHLARCGLIITSGMALGIDAEAHHGALSVSMPTVAVLGAGPDVVYPPSNAALASEIAAAGALVSELFPGTAPARHHFPRRNRIISGLSVGVLVVEAGLRSGSLITARLAGEQGREVFAIPGSIHNPMARGCHRIIREGAKLVETVDDILGELAGVLRPRPDTETAAPRDQNDSATALDGDYRMLLEACGTDPVTIDQIARRTKLTAAEVSSMLLILELQGVVESGPGGRYTRISKRV